MFVEDKALEQTARFMLNNDMTVTDFLGISELTNQSTTNCFVKAITKVGVDEASAYTLAKRSDLFPGPHLDIDTFATKMSSLYLVRLQKSKQITSAFHSLISPSFSENL